MKIRIKALIVVAALTISIFVILHLVGNLILLRSFVDLEEQETRKGVTRTMNAVANELTDLDGKVSDWAFWDDTYVFIQDLNQNYVDLNLADSTFTDLRLNLMMFVNSSGQIGYGKAFDLANRTEMPLPQGMDEQLAAHSLLWNHTDTESKTVGFVLLPEGPVLIASKPILTSQVEGPIKGTLIFGRYLDSYEMEQLAQTVALNLTVNSLNSLQVPADFYFARSMLSDKTPILVSTLNADSISGYALILDVLGNPAFVLRTDSPRDIYQQGLMTVNYFLYSVVGVCVAFSTSIFVMLRIGVLSPLSRLTRAIKEMGKSHSTPHLRSKLQTDEIELLSDAIKDAVDQRLAAIEELASMVGHDLRNPLSGIRGATYYIKTKYASMMDPRGREMLKIIEDSILYSNKIVNDLLEYSRKVKLELSETDPKSLITECISLVTLSEKIHVTNLTLDQPKLTVDVDKLKRAFTNVIQNAVDAMPEGGALIIKSRKVGDNIEFNFADTGVGMSKETLKKLWTPLFTTKAKGMGFGLPITKRFIDAQGGSISVASTIGRGTTVIVTMPAKARLANEVEIWTEISESTQIPSQNNTSSPRDCTKH